MSNVKVTFDDGTIISVPKGISYHEISSLCGEDDTALAVKVDRRIASLHDHIDGDKTISFLDMNSVDGNRIYVSGLKMIFECVIRNLFIGSKVEYVYSLPRGLMAQVKYGEIFTNDDLDKIKKMVAKVVEEDLVIQKYLIKNVDAIHFFDLEMENKVKAENIRNITDPTIVLYRLEDIINYYYTEMPYSTGVLNIYDIKYLGKNNFVISWPTEFDHGKIREYIHYKGVINAYKNGQEWLNKMDIPFINDVNDEIATGKISNFVKSCELKFNLGINETAKEIVDDGNIRFVMISGPSSSGKTTVTKRIANYFEIYGYKPIVVSIDDYFKEREDSPRDENGDFDFECLEATDMDYLNNDVKKLLNGEEVVLPTFDFITGHKKSSGKKVKFGEKTIVLFEGLHAINEKLFTMIPNDLTYRIFISPYIPLCLDEHNYISSYDLRLIRRMLRDFRTRGSSVENTINYWSKVRNGEEKYIIPCIPHADKIISTSLPYEVGILKAYVEPLLYSVEADSPHYGEARRLLSFLKQFFAISSEFVPKDSIIREFIGGNIDD